MAGKPIGLLYCELDLDTTKYTKAQEAILVGAKTTSLDIEKNWKTIGEKSDLMYDAMKANITNAYEMIKNKAGTSAQEIIRAEEAKNAKILALNDQQFGSHKSLFDSIKNNWMGLTALAMTVYAAMIKPIETYMENETAILKMGMAMKNQGDFSRAALADMVEYSEEIQRNTAYSHDQTLAIMANLKSYGLSNEQVKLATQAALDLAAAKANEGMTVERASEILGKAYLGIATGLKRVGIEIDDAAPKGELFNSVMMQIEQRFGGSAQAELITYAGQWKQLKNEWKDVQEFLGLVFLKTIEGLKTAFLGVATGFWAVVTGITQGLTWIAQGLEAFQRALGFEEAANATDVWVKTLQSAADSTKAATQEAAKMTVENAKSAVSFNNVSTAIDAMGKQGSRTLPMLTDETKGLAKTQAEILKAMTEENKLYYEEAIKDAEGLAKIHQTQGQNELITITELYDAEENALNDWYYKQVEIIEKEVENEKKTHKVGFDAEAVLKAKQDALYAQYDKKWTESENQRTLKTIEYSQKRLDTEVALYKTINQYSDESLDAEIAALEKKYTEIARYADDEELVERARNIAILKLYTDRTSSMSQATISLYGVINKFSQESHDAQMTIWTIEAQKYIDSKEGTFEDVSAWLVAKERDYRESELNAQISFYSQIAGFEQTSYNAQLELWESQAQKYKDMGYKIEAIEAWLSEKKQAYRENELQAQISVYDSIAGYEQKAYDLKCKLIDEKIAALALAKDKEGNLIYDMNTLVTYSEQQKYLAWLDCANKINALLIKEATDHADFYSKIKGYGEEEFKYKAEAIELERAKWLALGYSEEDVNKLLIQKTKDAYIECAKNSNDFFMGVNAGFIDMQSHQKTWGEAGIDMFKAFTTEAEKQLSDNLFNLFTGHFDKLKLDWSTLWEAMLKVLCDKIAAMGVAAAGAEIWSWFGWGWDTLFAKEGIWEVRGKGIGSTGGIPVIAHPGEMILPPGLADMFRDLLGKLGLGPAGMNLTYSGEEAYGKIMVDLFGPGEWTTGEWTGGQGLFGEDVYGKIWDSSALVDFFKPGGTGPIGEVFGEEEVSIPQDYLGIAMPEYLSSFWESLGLGDVASGISAWLDNIPTVSWAIVIPLLMSWLQGFLGGLFGWGGKERQAEVGAEQFQKYSVVAPGLQRYKLGLTTGALEPIPEIDAYRELLKKQSVDYFAYGKGVPVVGPTPQVIADLAYKQLMAPQDLARWFSIFDPYGLHPSGGGEPPNLLRGTYFDIQDQNAMYDPKTVFRWQDIDYPWAMHQQSEEERWGIYLAKAGYDPDVSMSLAIPTALEQLANWVTWGKGGLARGPSIFGERGAEWAVPTYEPERSSFLRDVGADPEAIGMAIVRHLGGNGISAENGDGKEIHVHLHIDGKEITQVIVGGLRGGDNELIKYVRKVANA